MDNFQRHLAKMRVKRLYVFLFLIVIVGILTAYYHATGITPRLFGFAPYSDILKFYDKAVEPGMPYISKLMEYPVMTGLFIHFTGVLGQTYAGYYLLSSFLLISFATIATYFLYHTIRKEEEKGLFIYWIFAPSMFFFLIYNWDIMAILFVVVALYFMKQNKSYPASLFLALGFCCKFYPVIYLLPLLIKRRRISEWIKITGVFGVVTLIINSPFLLSNFDGWYYSMLFHSQRSPNIDSIWAVINHFVPKLGIAQINMLSFFMFATVFIIAMWKYRHESTIRLCFLMTLIFLISNKVFSPQYLLWLLPFYVLVRMKKWRLFYALEFSNLIVFQTILLYYAAPLDGIFLDISLDIIFLDISRFFVVVRHIVLIYMLFDFLGWTSHISLKYRALRVFLLRNKATLI